MLLDCCRNLHSFYLEATHVINSLESSEKAYREGKHKEYYFEQLAFYRKLLNSSSFQRQLNIPKILRDTKRLKKQKAVLEANKHDLRVFNSLGHVGGPHVNRGLY